METALESSEVSLAGKAGAIASSYVDCVLAQGREIPGVMAALAGSPELAAVKRDCDLIFLEKCRGLLAPFAAGRTIPTGRLARHARRRRSPVARRSDARDRR